MKKRMEKRKKMDKRKTQKRAGTQLPVAHVRTRGNSGHLRSEPATSLPVRAASGNSTTSNNN